jgi:uncharacterized phage protein gp47/JayE
MATQDQIAESMIQQLRALDPSISAEIGTPERRIIDTVALAIADAQVDLNLINGAWDIDAKVGTDLDNMLAILGFGRQQGTRANGYVTFSRDTATTVPIVIKSGTTVFTPNGGDGSISVLFRTTTTVTLGVGQTRVIAPIEAVQSGTIGNVAANTITESVGSPIYGISAVNNDYAITGGAEIESDSELKARFTTAGPFRNLAGTYDQFMSLALSTKAKKAIVIGPISKYNEYVQVPLLADGAPDSGGNAGIEADHQFTTRLSTNVNAKHIYDDISYFVVNENGVAPIHYNAGYDFVMNLEPSAKNKGDAARYSYAIDPTSTVAPTIYQPNVTFTNVYIGPSDTRPENAIAPEDTLLFEYSYMSNASRNDYNRNILNCIDVYVNGEDPLPASATLARPGSSVPTFIFTSSDEYSAYYADNFRRVNDPGHRPLAGNIFTPLYNQPVTKAPDQISLSDTSFINGIHYWLVEEVTNLYGTVRARNGIEWSSTIRGKKNGDPDGGPYTGKYIMDSSVSSSSLLQNLPNSNATGSTLVAQTYNVTNRALSSDGTVTLTLGAAPDCKINDYINVTTIPEVNGTKLKVTAVDATSPGFSVSYKNPNAAPTFTITDAQIVSNGGSPATGILYLNTEGHGLEVGDHIKVSGASPQSSLNIADAAITYVGTSGGSDAEVIKYVMSATHADAAKATCSGTVTVLSYSTRAVSSSGGEVSISAVAAANATKIKVLDSSGFPDNGYVIVNGEIISYSAKDDTSDTLTVSGRGQFETTAKEIALPVSPAVGGYVGMLIQVADASGFPAGGGYLLIKPTQEQIGYTIPTASTSTLLQVTSRGANGSYVTSHSAGDVVNALLTSADQSFTVENYKYDANIINLQSTLETNKQVTTDVLAHKAKVRYFKPDVTIMYSKGANKLFVNESIQMALINYFNSLYFASEIQLSDILQTIHNVGGVDNVRWSTDFVNMSDIEDNAVPLIETNQYGDAVDRPMLDKILIGGNQVATKYQLYLPYIDNKIIEKLDVPQSVTATAGTGTGLTGGYYYVVTALNAEGGETTASSSAHITGLTNDDVVLTWSDVEGANSYNVYRSTTDSWTSGSVYLASVTDSTYTDTGDATDGGQPPVLNTAVVSIGSDYQSNRFAIRFGNNAPVTVGYDDLLVRTYDGGTTYSINDIVLLGNKYYRSTKDDNIDNDPETSSSSWKLDTNNKIGLEAKLNVDKRIVTLTSSNNFVAAPTFANPMTIEYVDKADKSALTIFATYVDAGPTVHYEDFQIGDSELASLPNGKLDDAGNTIMSSVMTIRVKSQNTWN